MFTIKHISGLGDEEIIQVETVRFSPGTQSCMAQNGGASTPPTVWISHLSRGVSETPLTGGTIFVMNDMGKTVARYDLGASPVPIMGDGLNDPRHQGLAQSQMQLPPHPTYGSYSAT